MSAGRDDGGADPVSDLAVCQRAERRILWKELVAIAVVVAVVVVRALWPT